MAKEIRDIIDGMLNTDLERKECYRDDAVRIDHCIHYLIGYLENEERTYKGKDIAMLLGTICKGKEWLEKKEAEVLAYTE